MGSVFGAGGAAHRRPRAAGGGCLAGGGWRLWVASPNVATRPAAPVVARAAATAFLLLVRSVSTVKFSFDSKIQFRQLSSVSTVKFRDERLMYFTSSALWLCILRHVLEMLLEFHSG